jgi:hypothetical protein
MHNVVFGHMRTLNTCAAEVWKADKERQDQYLLYPPGSGAAITRVEVEVTSAGAPREGVTVALTNTSLAAIATGGDGVAFFESTAMPELLDILLTDPELGEHAFSGEAIIIGDDNVVALEIA